MSLPSAPEFNRKVTISWYLLIAIVTAAVIAAVIIDRQINADRLFHTEINALKETMEKEDQRLHKRINNAKEDAEKGVKTHERIYHAGE